MSARVVAVTALLLDVLQDLGVRDDITPSEKDLVDLLCWHCDELQEIRRLATSEMQALAPALLEASA